MKVTVLLIVVVLAAVCCDAQRGNIFQRGWNSVRNTARRGYNYASDFAGGSKDMFRAYRDMRKANYIGADKYFHARGNYDAARRGTGGRHAAALLSNAREMFQSGSGRGHEDSAADQVANKWGRNGGDPNRFRPKGLPKIY